MSTKSSIANNSANASISDFPGDIPFNPDDAEIISDDDFVNIAIPEKKPQASAPVRKPKAKMVLKLRGQKPDPVETKAVPDDAEPQASVPARKPKSKIVLKELPKLKLRGQKPDPVETKAVPDDAKPQASVPARKPKSKMVLKELPKLNLKGQKPDPVASECVITDDEPENDNAECMSASQEFADRQQETAICDEIINAVSMQDDWAFSYDMLMEMDQFYAYAAVKKACQEAAGCDPIHIEDRDREFVVNELVNLMKKLRNILPKPTKDTIRMAGMSYDELRQMARRIARRNGITTPRLKNPANDARTNIRRVLGVHPDDDQVQQDFDAAVIDSRKNRVIGMKFNHPDEQGEGTGAFFTAQDSFEKSQKANLARDKAIAECQLASCKIALKLTTLAITCTLPGHFHVDSSIEDAETELKRLIANMRSTLKRKAVQNLIGKYIVEKHEDETPHVHMTLYVQDNEIDDVRDTVHQYFPAPDIDDRDNVEIVRNETAWKKYTDYRSGFIGMRRNIKSVFSDLYLQKDPNVPDINNRRLRLIHELIRNRKHKHMWLFLMNGFASDDINNSMNHRYDDISQSVDHTGHHDYQEQDEPDGQEMDELDEPDSHSHRDSHDGMGKIEFVVGDIRTSVFMNDKIIDRGPQITMDRNGNVIVQFPHKDDRNDPNGNRDHTQHQKVQTDTESPKSKGEKGSGCEGHKTAEKSKITEIKYKETGKERVRERTPDAPPDDPKPDGGWQPVPVPVPVSRTMPESRVRSPERAIRQTQGGIHMKPREPKQKLKFWRPAIFKVDGMFMTGAEMKEYRQHRS